MAGPEPKPFDKAFGRRVAERREARRGPDKLSQEALAERTEIPVKAIRQIEVGERPARLSEAAAIADALDVPLAHLLGIGEPSSLPTDEVAKYLAEIEHAMDENEAVRDEAQRRFEEADRQRDWYQDRVHWAIVRANGLLGRWSEVRAELDRRNP